MKYFVDILKQFTQTQRLIVLVLLLSFTTGGVLISQYMKTDDCRPLIEENLKMHSDFAKISSLLRAQQMKNNEIVLDTISFDGKQKEITQVPDSNPEVMNEILKIAESNQ